MNSYIGDPEKEHVAMPTDEPPVSAVAVKLPPFSTLEPLVWFKRAEIQFRLRKITDANTKADHVLASLPDEVFSQISSWIDQQPDDLKYDDVKVFLLQEFTLSTAARAQKLLGYPQQSLGDRTAHAVWNEMKSLATLPAKDSNGQLKQVDLMREIWLQTLPTAIRAALHDYEDLDMDELVKKADSLLDAARASRNNSAIQAALCRDDDINAVRIKPKLNNKPVPFRASLLESGLFAYHDKYGQLARKCVQGCKWRNTQARQSQGGSIRIQAVENHNYGFYLSDETGNTKFLVDTGATLSIYPASTAEKASLPIYPSTRLVAANGTDIKQYGARTINFCLSGRQYAWKFIIADVNTPLLGLDFLSHHNLLVDVRNRQLLDSETFSTTPLMQHKDRNVCKVTQVNSRYDALIEEYPDVFKPELRHEPSSPNKHGIQHHIKTNGRPIYSKFRRLAPDKLKSAKEAFAEMERMGLCEKGSSPWASPLHMVKKSDGSWRPCGDYRRLNVITEPDHYPIPNMADLTSNLHGARIFTKLDLLKGYFQVPVHPDDVPKTAIITPFGTWLFKYTTFGLRNSGATFQRMMDTIFGNIDFCAYYVDDILIYSRNETEHIDHVRQILKLLQDNGLVVRFDKCIFGASKVEFLGHEVSSTGVRPLQNKVSAVQDFPIPQTTHELQRFNGMVNYYHRFLKGLAHVMAPLHRCAGEKNKRLKWTPELQTAFEKTKEALATASALAYPNSNAKLFLMTDTSQTAVGASLEQEVNGTREPIGFFSKKLHPAETKYSTFDRELLAVYISVRHFRHLLEGRSFTIQTDHKPLVNALVKSGEPWSARQQRHLSAIAEYNCVMEYVPGKKNPVADALSRVEINSVHLGISYKELADAQCSDPETAASRTSITKLKWEDLPLDDNTTLLCDVSTGRPRPFIPRSKRRQVFDMIHGLSHPSGRSTAKLLTERFVWHGINKDARTWARNCIACQTSKVHRHVESGTGTFPQPLRRFGHIHVDMVGPLPPSDGHRYLFTITERSTRWPEAIPIVEATAQACVEALLSNWVSRFGIPDDITSDRGSTFTSQIWTALGHLMGSKVHHTTSYNPAANGMVERTHRTLKAALMARCKGPDWKAQLPWVLLGMRTTPKEGINFSPAEMMFGETLAVPGEFFPPDHNAPVEQRIRQLRHIVGKFRPCKQTYQSVGPKYMPNTLSTCEYVFIKHDAHRTPLTRPYRGPYKVKERKDKAFLISINDRDDWVSVDRLKPAYLDEHQPVPLTVTRAGRPVRPPDRFSASS